MRLGLTATWFCVLTMQLQFRFQTMESMHPRSNTAGSIQRGRPRPRSQSFSSTTDESNSISSVGLSSTDDTEFIFPRDDKLEQVYQRKMKLLNDIHNLKLQYADSLDQAEKNIRIIGVRELLKVQQDWKLERQQAGSDIRLLEVAEGKKKRRQKLLWQNLHRQLQLTQNSYSQKFEPKLKVAYDELRELRLQAEPYG